jgi:hypothetical protein
VGGITVSAPVVPVGCEPAIRCSVLPSQTGGRTD